MALTVEERVTALEAQARQQEGAITALGARMDAVQAALGLLDLRLQAVEGAFEGEQRVLTDYFAARAVQGLHLRAADYEKRLARLAGPMTR